MNQSFSNISRIKLEYVEGFPITIVEFLDGSFKILQGKFSLAEVKQELKKDEPR